MPTSVPKPTPIFRLVHIECLETILRRKAMTASNHIPDDGLPYRTIHNVSIQDARHRKRVKCGPGGTLHDYVPFYFGYRSPMLLQLKTGQVEGYIEGQEPLLHLVSSVEAVIQAGCEYVFTDGHAIAAYSETFDSPADLARVDWDAVYARYWLSTTEDMDRQRRKQAEFLVHQLCPWSVVQEIGVVSETAKAEVERIVGKFPQGMRRPVKIRPEWYY